MSGVIAISDAIPTMGALKTLHLHENDIEVCLPLIAGACRANGVRLVARRATRTAAVPARR
jgi:hypothetical protein